MLQKVDNYDSFLWIQAALLRSFLATGVGDGQQGSDATTRSMQ